MSCLTIKRVIDFDDTVPRAAESMSPLVFRAKRSRLIDDCSSPQFSPLKALQPNFVPQTAAEPVEKFAAMVLSRKRLALLKRLEETEEDDKASSENASLVQAMARKSKGPSEVTFTLEQVRSIVEKAVREREEELAQQYDQVLQERLGEQLATFAKYHEDFIRTRLSHATSSYIM